MLREVNWSSDRSYRTGTDDEPFQFYLEALSNSTRLDLLLGYFSSSAINVLSLGFASFLYSGGKVRLIANHILSKDDCDAIMIGLDGNVKAKLFDLSDINTIAQALDEYNKHFFECLSWLIKERHIQIVIIKPKKSLGIAHYKSGVFSDEHDSVGFKASSNFTAFGLLENLEEIDIFLSWENSRSSRFIDCQNNYFESIFYGKADFVDYLNVKEVTLAIKDAFGSKSINELLIQEKELIAKKKLSLTREKIKKIVEKVESKIKLAIIEPRFPYPDGPRDYQILAYKKWAENSFKGVFAMATGTGKTITSLNCLLQLYKKEGTYRAIITVPTISLLQQWKEECKKFNFRNIVTVSSKEKWNETLAFLNTASKLIDTSYIVIVTYASFSRPKFLSHLNLFPSNTLMIADEMHNIGAPKMLEVLPKIELKYRIGLSATPSRQFDIEGNLAIEEFFNDKYPYVYSYSMKQALEVGWLSKYMYHPHIVTLKEDELQDYIEISKKLIKYLDSQTGKYKECKEVDDLLLKRKRIIHKAANKKLVFDSIVRQEFKKRGNLKYTLVYVPEGKNPDYMNIDFSLEDADEMKLINEYTRIVKDIDFSIFVSQYTAGTKNREKTLADFESGNTHVLTSMKCLDEGVDVPRSELAIFCASTGNPRQFIQRRGRVLRKHPDKIHATIHDLVVVPELDSAEDYFEMERNLIRSELKRVVDFSQLSMNKIETYEELRDVLEFYNLNLNDILKEIS